MSADFESTASTRRVVEALYRCGNSGDLQGALALVDPGVVLHEPSFLPFGGAYKGIEGFTAAFQNVVASGVQLAQLRVQRLIVDGDRAFGVLHVPAPGGEAIFAEEFVVRGGKVTEITLYYHHAAALQLVAGTPI